MLRTGRGYSTQFAMEPRSQILHYNIQWYSVILVWLNGMADPLKTSTPLYLASKYGVLAVVQVLLKHDSDVNAVTRNG